MTEHPAIRCAICREEQAGLDGWFLVTENRWTDRVKILSWNPSLVSHPGLYAACCAAHVQQLVVHWMATGSLEYPFAQSRPKRRRSLRRRHEPAPEMSEREPTLQGSKVLGELAVHRESLERVLSENPESLAGILKALLSALGEAPVPAIDPELEEVQEEDLYDLVEV
jgi:hypothetical protein